MRSVVQRVRAAHVDVGDDRVGEIGPGLCALVGVTHGDTEAQAAKLADKLAGLRIFDDEQGVMNRSVADAGGAVEAALELADSEARELLERAAVADLDVDPALEARNLIAAATRRQLTRRRTVVDVEELRAMRDARLALEQMDDPGASEAAAEALLGWLQGCTREPE